VARERRAHQLRARAEIPVRGKPASDVIRAQELRDLRHLRQHVDKRAMLCDRPATRRADRAMRVRLPHVHRERHRHRLGQGDSPRDVRVDTHPLRVDFECSEHRGDVFCRAPCEMRQLGQELRVRALLRRAETSSAAGAEVVRSGDLSVDLMRRECFRGETPLQLKPKEFDLLLFFLRNRGRAVTREQLLNQIWGYEFAGDTRTVDVHIRWLRQKIEEDPAVPRRLITVRGTGYRFEG